MKSRFFILKCNNIIQIHIVVLSNSHLTRSFGIPLTTPLQDFEFHEFFIKYGEEYNDNIIFQVNRSNK